jgi:uncharacterized membrane protein
LGIVYRFIYVLQRRNCLFIFLLIFFGAVGSLGRRVAGSGALALEGGVPVVLDGFGT